MFMSKKCIQLIRIPFIGGRILDLYKLYTLVAKKGGLAEVIRNDLFGSIVKEMNIKMNAKSAKYQVKQKYIDLLYPFECEMKGFGNIHDLENSLQKHTSKHCQPSSSNEEDNVDDGDKELEEEGVTDKSSIQGEHDEDGDKKVEEEGITYKKHQNQIKMVSKLYIFENINLK